MFSNNQRPNAKSKAKRRSKKRIGMKLDGVKIFSILCRTAVLLSTLLVAQNAMNTLNGQEEFLWLFLGTVAGCATLASSGLSK